MFPSHRGATFETARRTVGVLALGAVLAACRPPVVERSQILASLRPVDSARPMVVFSQIQGNACGADAVLGAIRAMKRLNGVDGYLEVVLQETGTGDSLCAKATAYPFRYGTNAAPSPVIRAGEEGTDPVLIPGREPPEAGASGASASAGFDCAAACRRHADLIAQGSVAVALARDRCEQRCKQPDTKYQACIATASDAEQARACSVK